MRFYQDTDEVRFGGGRCLRQERMEEDDTGPWSGTLAGQGRRGRKMTWLTEQWPECINNKLSRVLTVDINAWNETFNSTPFQVFSVNFQEYSHIQTVRNANIYTRYKKHGHLLTNTEIVLTSVSVKGHHFNVAELTDRFN